MKPFSAPWAGKIPWRRPWQPTPVFFPGKSHGHRSLAGQSPRGAKRWTQLKPLSTHTHTVLFPSDLAEPLAGKEGPTFSCWAIIATQQALSSPLISRSYSSWLCGNKLYKKKIMVLKIITIIVTLQCTLKSLTYMNIFNARKSYEVDRNTHCTDEEMEAQRSRAGTPPLEDVCRKQK